MGKEFDLPDGFEIKSGDCFLCGLIDINWEERTLLLTGLCGNNGEEMDPHDVWLRLKEPPPDGVERSAVVVFDSHGDSCQLAHYDLKQFEKECYGPAE